MTELEVMKTINLERSRVLATISGMLRLSDADTARVDNQLTLLLDRVNSVHLAQTNGHSLESFQHREKNRD